MLLQTIHNDFITIWLDKKYENNICILVDILPIIQKVKNELITNKSEIESK